MTGDGQVSEWVLEIHRPGKEPVIVQAKDGLTMGRHPDNDVVIEDARASAHHAEIRAQGDSFVLVDLGSTNKTKIKPNMTTTPASFASMNQNDGTERRIAKNGRKYHSGTISSGVLRKSAFS